jgi:hypothetical protein
MELLFCSDPSNPRHPDEVYQAEAAAAERLGIPFALVDHDRPESHATLRPEGEDLQRAWQQSVYPIARRMAVEIKLPRRNT